MGTGPPDLPILRKLQCPKQKAASYVCDSLRGRLWRAQGGSYETPDVSIQSSATRGAVCWPPPCPPVARWGVMTRPTQPVRGSPESAPWAPNPSPTPSTHQSRPRLLLRRHGPHSGKQRHALPGGRPQHRLRAWEGLGGPGPQLSHYRPPADLRRGGLPWAPGRDHAQSPGEGLSGVGGGDISAARSPASGHTAGLPSTQHPLPPPPVPGQGP